MKVITETNVSHDYIPSSCDHFWSCKCTGRTVVTCMLCGGPVRCIKKRGPGYDRKTGREEDTSYCVSHEHECEATDV